jgi:hypothetical protein
MVEQIWIPIIREAGRKLTENPDPFLDFPQKQATTVAGDRSAIKLRPNLASLLGMKSEIFLGTLCDHKAVASSGRISFGQKELCHEATAFFYLL